GLGDGGIGTQPAHAGVLIDRSVRLGRNQELLLQGLVLAEVMKLVKHVHEVGLLDFGPPLQDVLLGSLDNETVHAEAGGGGVAKRIHAALPLKLGPEANPGFICNAVAELSPCPAVSL